MSSGDRHSWWAVPSGMNATGRPGPAVHCCSIWSCRRQGWAHRQAWGKIRWACFAAVRLGRSLSRHYKGGSPRSSQPAPPISTLRITNFQRQSAALYLLAMQIRVALRVQHSIRLGLFCVRPCSTEERAAISFLHQSDTMQASDRAEGCF